MKKKIIVFFVISILYILFFPEFKEKVLDRDYYVTFAVDGEKNEASAGTVVRVNVILADGQTYDLSKIIRPKEWGGESELVNAGNVAAGLVTKIKYKNSLEIIFATGPDCGRVSVTNRKETKVLDLYGPEVGEVHCVFEKE